MFSIILNPDFRVTGDQFPEKSGSGDSRSVATREETEAGKYESEIKELSGCLRN